MEGNFGIGWGSPRVLMPEEGEGEEEEEGGGGAGGYFRHK